MCEKICKLSAFCIIGSCLLELIDLILDWTFYVLLFQTNQESVSNAVNLRTAVLVFAIVGTILFLTSLLASIVKLVIHREGSLIHEKAAKSLTILSMVRTWIEDLPQILLALFIAIKAAKPISFVQYVKAWYALSVATLQIMRLVVGLKLCCQNKPERWEKRRMIVETIGHVSVCLVALFLLVQLYADKF